MHRSLLITAVAIAGLVAATILLSWSPETWSAIAAWLTAGVAIAAGVIAVGQLSEARRLRKEQAQPYVAMFTETKPEVDEQFVDLVINNFGQTAAFNVRIRIEPWPHRADDSHSRVWLPEHIPTLVPGQEWRTHWDFGPRRAGSDLPTRHAATVHFQDSQEESFRLQYVLDWGIYENRMQVTTYGAHHAAKALREIQKTTSRWTESAAGGLSVVSRDGDARDDRLRDELDDRRSSAETTADADDSPDDDSPEEDEP
jgi:hypothetical protein